MRHLNLNLYFQPLECSERVLHPLQNYLQIDYASDNIRMNNILHVFIDSLPENEEFKIRIPLKRYGKTSEISEVVSFLASDGAGYITGQNIRVDGGITKSV